MLGKQAAQTMASRSTPVGTSMPTASGYTSSLSTKPVSAGAAAMGQNNQVTSGWRSVVNPLIGRVITNIRRPVGYTEFGGTSSLADKARAVIHDKPAYSYGDSKFDPVASEAARRLPLWDAYWDRNTNRGDTSWYNRVGKEFKVKPGSYVYDDIETSIANRLFANNLKGQDNTEIHGSAIGNAMARLKPIGSGDFYEYSIRDPWNFDLHPDEKLTLKNIRSDGVSLIARQAAEFFGGKNPPVVTQKGITSDKLSPLYPYFSFSDSVPINNMDLFHADKISPNAVYKQEVDRRNEFKISPYRSSRDITDDSLKSLNFRLNSLGEKDNILEQIGTYYENNPDKDVVFVTPIHHK